MGYSGDTNGVFRRYQWGIQKIPMEYSEDINGVFRRYQWGINKIPMGYSEDTNGVFRRYQWGIQKIPMVERQKIQRAKRKAMVKTKQKHYTEK